MNILPLPHPMNSVPSSPESGIAYHLQMPIGKIEVSQNAAEAYQLEPLSADVRPGPGEVVERGPDENAAINILIVGPEELDVGRNLIDRSQPGQSHAVVQIGRAVDQAVSDTVKEIEENPVVAAFVEEIFAEPVADQIRREFPEQYTQTLEMAVAEATAGSLYERAYQIAENRLFRTVRTLGACIIGGCAVPAIVAPILDQALGMEGGLAAPAGGVIAANVVINTFGILAVLRTSMLRPAVSPEQIATIQEDAQLARMVFHMGFSRRHFDGAFESPEDE